MARPSPPPRGAALLLVLVAVAVVTALATDLAYETRVRLQIAAHARDELRAGALAQSGVAMARLVLTFQAQLDQTSGAACAAMNAITGALQPNTTQQGTTKAGGTQAGGTQAGGAVGAGGTGCPRPQLWNLVPVGSLLTDMLFPPEGGAASTRESGDSPLPAPTGEDGAYQASIEDEGQKVNMQFDGFISGGGTIGPQVGALLQLVCDPKWDPLFDREDAQGQRWTRPDLLVHLRDFVDEDSASSALKVAFPAGACSFQVPPAPFEQGFGDENGPYDRGTDRYKAKNARFDSLEELHLVAGVSEAFMAAFGDQVTVYMPKDAGMNVNSKDPRQQLNLAKLMADPASLAVVNDPAFGPKLTKALSDMTMGGFLTLTPVQFAGILQTLGVNVQNAYVTQTQNNPFTDKSVVFHIKASGTVGDVTRRVDAVVSFDTNQNRPTAADASTGQPVAGRLIHWREE